MLMVMLLIVFIWAIWKVLVFGIKAAWGLLKIIAIVIMLPLLIVEMACIGFVYFAIPLLIIIGLIALIGGAVKTR